MSRINDEDFDIPLEVHSAFNIFFDTFLEKTNDNNLKKQSTYHELVWLLFSNTASTLGQHPPTVQVSKELSRANQGTASLLMMTKVKRRVKRRASLPQNRL